MSPVEKRWRKLKIFTKRRTTSLDPGLQLSPDSGSGSTKEYTAKTKIPNFHSGTVFERDHTHNRYQGDAAFDLPQTPSGSVTPKPRAGSLPLDNQRNPAIQSKASLYSLQRDDCKIGSPRKKRTPRTPDRFVPIRENVQQAAQRFRTNKPVSSLSTQERLVRSFYTSGLPLSSSLSNEPPHLDQTTLAIPQRRTGRFEHAAVGRNVHHLHRLLTVACLTRKLQSHQSTRQRVSGPARNFRHQTVSASEDLFNRR